MSKTRDRDRMTFETTLLMKRAIRLRAAIDGLKPAGVVNAALQAHLIREIAIAQGRLAESRSKINGAQRGAKCHRRS